MDIELSLHLTSDQLQFKNIYLEAEGMGGVAPNVICITVRLSDCFVLDFGNFMVHVQSIFNLERSRMLSLTLQIATST